MPDKCKDCGGSSRVTVWCDGSRNYYGVVCESCGLAIGGFDSAGEAVEMWNAKRTEGAQ